MSEIRIKKENETLGEFFECLREERKRNSDQVLAHTSLKVWREGQDVFGLSTWSDYNPAPDGEIDDYDGWECVASEGKYQLADENGVLAWNGTVYHDEWFLSTAEIKSIGLGDALDILAPEAVRV